LRNHILAKHPNIAPKEELPDIVAQCEEPINRPTAADCPLCDDWEKNFAKSQYGGDFSKLRKHLGRHMEQLALFALPRAEPDDDRSDEEGELDEEEEKEEEEEEEEADEVQDVDDDVSIPDQKGINEIFFSNISEDVTTAILIPFFERFGRVLEARIIRDEETTRSLGFGFITFENKAAVDACLRQPLVILGKPVEVRKPTVGDLWIQHQRRHNKTTPTLTCIFCPDRRLYSIEKELKDHVKKDHRDRLPTDDRELEAFLENCAIESAQKNPQIGIPHGSESPLVNRKPFEQNLFPFHRLFVGNINFSITESDLENVFEPFGELEYVQLQKDEQSRSRGYGFVL